MSFFEFAAVSFAYGEREVLRDVCFVLEKGDFLAVVGPNGSGKTTLVRLLVGLAVPSSGSVRYGPEGRPTVGYLPQRSSSADPRFPATAQEVVASGLLGAKPFPKRLSSADRERIDEALRMLQVEDLRKRQVGRLSGGQQQRVHLARALVGDPKLLVLDEPTGALDPGTRECFYETVEHLNRVKGTTIVFVTHDVDAAKGFASTLLFLDRSVVYFGSVEGFDPKNLECYFGAGHDHAGRRCGG